MQLMDRSLNSNTAYWMITLGLPDKTRAEENEASGQLNPTQEALGRSIQPATNPAKLSKEIVAAFHGLANPANPRLSLAPRRGLQPEAHCLGPLSGGSIAIGAISLGRGEMPCIPLRRYGGRCWWENYQGRQEFLGVVTVIGVGRGYDHPQRHGPAITGQL